MPTRNVDWAGRVLEADGALCASGALAHAALVSTSRMASTDRTLFCPTPRSP
jgi:hypothetical protein